MFQGGVDQQLGEERDSLPALPIAQRQQPWRKQDELGCLSQRLRGRLRSVGGVTPHSKRGPFPLRDRTTEIVNLRRWAVSQTRESTQAGLGKEVGCGGAAQMSTRNRPRTRQAQSSAAPSRTPRPRKAQQRGPTEAIRDRDRVHATSPSVSVAARRASKPNARGHQASTGVRRPSGRGARIATRCPPRRGELQRASNVISTPTRQLAMTDVAIRLRTVYVRARVSSATPATGRGRGAHKAKPNMTTGDPMRSNQKPTVWGSPITSQTWSAAPAGGSSRHPAPRTPPPNTPMTRAAAAAPKAIQAFRMLVRSETGL